MLPRAIVALLLAGTPLLTNSAGAHFLGKSGVNQQLVLAAPAAKQDETKPMQIGLLQIGKLIQKPDKLPAEIKEFDTAKWRMELLLTWAIWLVLCGLIYFTCYRNEVPIPKRQVTYIPDDKQQRLEDLFQKGHFRCFEDSNICICSFFFPGLRWSDTTSQAGFMSFWLAFASFFTLMLLNCLILLEMYSLFTLVLILYFRHQLRAKLDLEAWNFNTCLRDCCFICFCPCCAIAQEARVVKEAIEMGHEPLKAPEPS
jgi:Cys-rich protein (TIGR01571 family)